MDSSENQENQNSDTEDVEQTSEEQVNAPQGEEEHQTHTAALVFLVIVVMVVSFIALTDGDGISLPSLNDGNFDDEFNISDYETEEELMAALRQQPSYGGAVPQRAVATTDTTSLALIPSTLFVDEPNITQNRLIGDEGNHQSVGFTTERSSGDLYDEYTTWLEDNDYEVYQELEEAEGFKLAATGPQDQQVTISVFNPTADQPQAQVRINYIAE